MRSGNGRKAAGMTAPRFDTSLVAPVFWRCRFKDGGGRDKPGHEDAGRMRRRLPTVILAQARIQNR